MNYTTLTENYWYLIGGVLSIIIISFTEFRKHPKGFIEVSVALLIGWFIVLPLILSYFLNRAIRENDFMYTINTGLCKKCSKKAHIECEIGSSRGDIDEIYTEITCECRDHNDSWAHFSPGNKIYKYLIKDNIQFTKNRWRVSKVN